MTGKNGNQWDIVERTLTGDTHPQLVRDRKASAI